MPKLYRRPGSPYWYASGYDAQGARWKRSTKQTNKRRAADAAREIERRLLGAGDAGAVTLLEALDHLRAHKERLGRAPATMEILKEKGRALMRHFGTAYDIRTLHLRDVEAYLDTRRLDGVSDHTIEKEVRHLLEALRRLKRLGKLPADLDPVSLRPEALRAAQVYQPRDRWLSVEEYSQIREVIRPDRWRRWLTLCVRTGLRRGEVAQSVEDWSTGEIVVGQTKGKAQERRIPMHPEVRLILREHPLPWTGPDPRAFNNALRRACKDVGIPHASPNDLRRTFASWLCNAGVAELVVVKLMGHQDSKMIRRVYAQLAPATLADAIGRMPAAPMLRAVGDGS